MRRGAEVRGLRLRLFLRLPVQPLLELADDADAARAQPAARLRAAVRRRVARRAPGEPATPPARAAVDPRLRPRRRPRRCSAGSAPQDRQKLDQYLTGVREIETRIEKAERFGDVRDPAVETPAGHPDRLRGVHPAHVRHAGPGVPDRLDAGRDVPARPRRQQPLVRPDRHLRGAPRPDPPPEPAGLDREGRRHRPVVRPPVRPVPGEARGDEGRRRQVAAPQLDDRLRQRQRRRQPPHPRQPAGHPGRRRRRHADARAATSSTAPSR